MTTKKHKVKKRHLRQSKKNIFFNKKVLYYFETVSSRKEYCRTAGQHVHQPDRVRVLLLLPRESAGQTPGKVQGGVADPAPHYPDPTLSMLTWIQI